MLKMVNIELPKNKFGKFLTEAYKGVDLVRIEAEYARLSLKKIFGNNREHFH